MLTKLTVHSAQNRTSSAQSTLSGIVFGESHLMIIYSFRHIRRTLDCVLSVMWRLRHELEVARIEEVAPL